MRQAAAPRVPWWLAALASPPNVALVCAVLSAVVLTLVRPSFVRANAHSLSLLRVAVWTAVAGLATLVVAWRLRSSRSFHQGMERVLRGRAPSVASVGGGEAAAREDARVALRF